MEFSKEAKIRLEALARFIKEELGKGLAAKGHINTGKLLDSIEVDILDELGAVVLEGKFEDYGIFQDTGTRAGSLRNIDALTVWVRQRLNAPPEKARGIAFAIAKTHAKVGMHSKDGRPNPAAAGWMTETLDRISDDILKRLDEIFDIDINIFVDNVARQFERV